MQAKSAKKVKTFTIGFAEEHFNEAIFARAVAQHLRTEHTEMLLSSAEALSLVPDLPLVYDEPFADSSQLPTQLVMRLARGSVTVALSGDGGDELFGGYNRYQLAPRIWSTMKWVPARARNSLASALLSVTASRWDSFLGTFAGCMSLAQPGDKLHKLGKRIRSVGSVDDLFFSLVSEWEQPGHIVRDAREPVSLLSDRTSWPALRDPVARMMALDSVSYLPDDILVKVDRASMSRSLEMRAPYLDPRVVQFAWSLPMHMKFRRGQGKWLLREVLQRHVPPRLINRPKMGFGVPLDEWLRGPLREWAECLLDPVTMLHQGFLEPAAIRPVWEEHLQGGSNGHRLWSVLMFQAWLAHTKSQ
jgi:asparagine synthase (glutamine-hydrolysing)